MYVRMITFHLKPDIDKDGATLVYDEIIAEQKGQIGFKGCALLLDEEASTAISLTYWADERCAGTAGEHILPILFERTAELSERPPEITGYHVLDHHLLQEFSDALA